MSYKSAIAHLPNGVDVDYIDSGPVSGTPLYKTWILMHGTGFNAYVFGKLCDVATSKSIRIIAPHQQGYANSTFFTEDDLEDLRNGEKRFFDLLASWMADFIHHIIMNERIPEPDEDRQNGGITLLGWSSGSMAIMALLSDTVVHHPEKHSTLRRYLTDVVFDEPPNKALGYKALAKPPPNNLPFKIWVSSYYDVPDDWDGNPDELDHRTPDKPASTDSWNEEDWDRMFNSKPTIASEIFSKSEAAQATLRQMTNQVFFDKRNADSIFPDIRLMYLICWKSCSGAFLGYYAIHQQFLQRTARNEYTRPVKFQIVKDRNHFWHYDFPDEFLSLINLIVRYRIMI